MNTAYLILGGNIGDKRQNLEKTREKIDSLAGAITKKSDIFVTGAWGNTSQPDFYNQAVCISTKLAPSALLETLLKIEALAGRVRNEQKWAERTMDIDILFYNEEVISGPHLKIPHPHVQDRRFVLAPLAQIAGDLVHPVLHKTIDQLLKECTDTSAVNILSATQ